MKLIVNGEEAQVPDGLTVAGLLTHLAVKPGRVAVELNLAVVRKERFSTQPLVEGDKVEIVAFVGGG